MFINSKIFNSRNFALCFISFFSFLYFLKFIVLSNGNVLNFYPFITPDGFDWIVEGEYLLKSLYSHSNMPILPVLRPPLFVFVSFLDYYSGARGIIFSACYALSILFSYIFILKIVDMHYSEMKKTSWFVIPLLISVTLYPVNFIRVYVLSDVLAVCLSLCSVYLLLKFFESRNTVRAIMVATCLLAAGLTQTYALIPCLTFVLVKTISTCRKKINQENYLLGLFFGVMVLFLLVTYIWRNSLPHIITPSNFDLLKLSFGMFDFYINTWGYFFAPILIFLIFIFFSNIEVSEKSLISLSTFLVTFLMGFLTFFYQWPESRFTYYFWPYLLISICTLLKNGKNIRASAFLSILLLTFSIITPNDYWSPKLNTLSLNLNKNWIFIYFESKPVNRKLSECALTDCADNNFLLESDSYVKSVIAVHKAIETINKSN